MKLNLTSGHRLIGIASLAFALVTGTQAWAQTKKAPSDAAVEAVIKKAFAQRFEGMPPVEWVTRAPLPGLWEVKAGDEIFYSDPTGNYVVIGKIINTETKRNLTQEKLDKIFAIDFNKLPVKDAIVWKTGNGERKIAIFADPNCGYCKHLEQSLTKVNNLTVYTFLYPILGQDSLKKAEDVWCSKDKAAVWTSWMRDNKSIPDVSVSGCETPLARNMQLGRKHRISGTPAVIFENGYRAPGAIPPEEIEKRLVAISQKK